MNPRFMWMWFNGGEEFSSLNYGDDTFFSSKEEAITACGNYIRDDHSADVDGEDIYVVEVVEVITGTIRSSGFHLAKETKVK